MKPSMIAIPESLTAAGQTVEIRKDGTTYVTGTPAASSIPPTPVATWDVMPTPTTPATNLRTTLSLVDMIQSPKVEQQTVMVQRPYQMVYQGVPVVAAQPVQAQALPPGATVVQAQPAAPPETMATTMTVQPATVGHIPPPPPAAAPVVVPAADPAEEARATSQALQAAAVQLGLVPQQQHQQAVPQTQPCASSVAVGTIQPPRYTATVHTLQQAPATTTLLPPSMGTQPHSVSTVITAQPQRMVPPPPAAPAPTVVFTPKASSVPMMPAMAVAAPVSMGAPPALPAAALAVPTASSGMPESDLKVLLSLAVSSGNQQAVDALLRQAQQGGMSPERFRTLVDSVQTKTG